MNNNNVTPFVEGMYVSYGHLYSKDGCTYKYLGESLIADTWLDVFTDMKLI